MTPAEKELLEILKSKRTVTTEGNREYWSELKYSGGSIYTRGGSTFPHTTDYNREVRKKEALEIIRNYLWSEANNWKLTDEELVEFWKDSLRDTP